ncbi:MAG TPA: hypothetical protein VIW69_13735 [Candidatus Elarobacter sp.]
MTIRLLLAAAAVAVAALVPPAHTAQAEAVTACGETHLRDSFISTELQQKAQIEILLAAGITAPNPQKDQFAQIARAVFVCAQTDALIDLVPITDTGFGRGPLFSATAPGPHNGQTNPLRIKKQKEELEKRAALAIHTVLFTPEQFTGSDILGTLWTAGNALRQSGAPKRVVVIVANGWHQTRSIDIFTYHKPPDLVAGDVVKKLRAEHRMPNLTDTDVFVAGISKGANGMRIDEGGLSSLCTFWRKIVTESGGVMHDDSCGRMLPGMTEGLATPSPQ